MTATYAESHESLIEQLDARVREQVRHEGVDSRRQGWFGGSPKAWCGTTTSAA
ncbi:hypothetical protein [Nocardioides sp.]|uniref:hypothetical protein n=1 Tax=Nocardioides sp. TaxID=35761 RepID=UPI003D14EAEA